MRSLFFFTLSAAVFIAHFACGAPLNPKVTPEELFRLRILPEPLVPVGAVEPSQTRELIESLDAYSRRQRPDDLSALESYVAGAQGSPWKVSAQLNLGLLQYTHGYFQRCLASFGQVWEAGRGGAEPALKAMADRAGGEYVKMLSRLGRMEEVRAFFKAAEGRGFEGSATELVSAARQGLALMDERPEIAFRCGPLALGSVLRSLGKSDAADRTIELKSTTEGTSLRQVRELAGRLGLPLQGARRDPGSAVVVPGIVHWKVGHYAAVLRKEGALYLTQDPTFGNDTWVSAECLDEEASGAFLVPAGALPPGWATMGDDALERVHGKGATASSDQDQTTPDDHKVRNCDSARGMAIHNFHTMLVSLNITDTPVGYRPAYGPSVFFTATYNQREANQPTFFRYSNLGPKWTHNWLSYVTDQPFNPSIASVAVAGGGTHRFTGYDSSTGRFAPQLQSRAVLRRVSTQPIVYELEYPDGSKDRFEDSDGSTSSTRQVFLTRRIDPFGNTVVLKYDGLLRLTSITDATGISTTFRYVSDTDYLIREVTDPFGRKSVLTYDNGRLSRIRDVLGIDSSFRYESGVDFISALETPYGTNRFATWEQGRTRRLTATDPEGGVGVRLAPPSSV